MKNKIISSLLVLFSIGCCTSQIKPQPPTSTEITVNTTKPIEVVKEKEEEYVELQDPLKRWAISLPVDTTVDLDSMSFVLHPEDFYKQSTITIFTVHNDDSLEKIVDDGAKEIQNMGAKDIVISKNDNYYKLSSIKNDLIILQYAYKKDDFVAVLGFGYNSSIDTKYMEKTADKVASTFVLK